MKKDQDKNTNQSHQGMTRRGFLTTVGAGAVGVAASGTLLSGQKAEAQEVMQAKEMTKITLVVNGRRRRLLVEPRWSLLFVLRERFNLTGTKDGCSRGECGYCTVLIDGVPRDACLTLAVEAEGSQITTVEGLMKGEELGPVQKAFVEEDGMQCGFCTPGMIMSAEGLLEANSNPSDEEILEGMSGTVCRCGAYANIFKAVKRAAALK
jgi:xanthine dehydrogenase YagT iron-sulfur-binding subunit